MLCPQCEGKIFLQPCTACYGTGQFNSLRKVSPPKVAGDSGVSSGGQQVSDQREGMGNGPSYDAESRD